MKKLLLPLLFICVPLVAVGRIDTADIVSSQEIYKTVQSRVPYQYCYEKSFRRGYRGDGSATNELIGGIIGGAIGNRFGKGGGKDATTVAGALLGASIANDRERASYRNNNPYQTKEVCETRYRYQPEERFSHYLITYNYKGKNYTYQSRHKPKSDKVNVRVSVQVAPENGRMYQN